MTRLRWALALFIGLAATPAFPIARGEPVTPADFQRQFPWLVVIQDRSGQSLCTGTLISRRWVLTAGHCLGDDLEVRAGSVSRAGTRRVAVREVIRHPRFRGGQDVAYDLGLLRLARPLRIRPAALPTLAEGWTLLRGGNTALLAGWGRTEAGAPHPDQVHVVEVRLNSLRVSPYAFSFWSEVGGPCGGDSGGPLVMALPGGERLVMGVASITDGNLCVRGGGLAAYADVMRLRDFIEAHVADLPERAPPVNFGPAGS